MPYRFGSFVADPAAYRLRRGETAIDLSPKALDLLFLFASRPGELVTKEDMLKALWPGLAVTDNALTQVVSELRQALGDAPASPRYVETVPRRGYRFVADVVEETGSYAAEAPARRPRSVAVLSFTNMTADPDLDWLSAGIAETLTGDLRASSDLRVMDRDLLPRVPPGGEAEAGRRAAVDLVVTGSIQGSGDRLRLTARVIDAATREVVAQAKADGALADVFHLQDRLVLDLVSGLSLRLTDSARARISARETASLEAYRTLTEGRLRLETLDPAEVPAAIADFERALALDPQYALAHVGLAHARFWVFQASRARSRPDRAQLDAALAHARAAVGIDPGLAEAHAALAFLLAGADPSVESDEAVAAGRRAVAIEPGNWRHLFRLAVAAWGEERLRCVDGVTAQYPQLAHAYFLAATVHVARGRLDRAEEVLRTGAAFDGAPPAGAVRFPSSGLHWLTGLIRLASGDTTGATQAFDRELAAKGRSLYADEFAMDAWDGHGFTRLECGDAAGAAAMFERALARVPDHARSLVGLAEAAARQGQRDRAAALMAQASRVIDALQKGGRETESVLARAHWLIASSRQPEALRTLASLLDTAPRGPAGWTLPVEPWLAAGRRTAEGRALLARLAERAR